MSSTQNITLVGCGAISRMFYGSALAALERRGVAAVTTLVDPAAGNRGQVAERFPQARQFATLEEAPLRSGDLVIVATPVRFHAEHSIHALERGADVLCEKPIAFSIAEGRRMVEVAERCGKLLAIGHYRRFFPAMETLGTLIRDQPFGGLREFHISEGNASGWDAASDSFFNPASSPGGVFHDVGVHVLDLVLHWLGEPSTFEYQDDAMGGLEINAQLRMKFPDGVRGAVQLSKDVPNANLHTYRFERATVRWKAMAANNLEVEVHGLPYRLDSNLREHMGVGGGTRPARSDPQSFTAQLLDVIEAARSRRPPRVTGQSALRCVEFIERCYAERKILPIPWMSKCELSAAAGRQHPEPISL